MTKAKPFIENKFQKVIKSNKLLGIKIFQVNDHYIHFPKDKLWIIDGGIQLNFSNYIFSFSWDNLIDSFVFEEKKFEEIYTENNYTELNNELFYQLKNKDIINVEFKWITCDVIIDYTMRTRKEKKLTELRLNFDSNNYLQIAAIDYDIENEKCPNNFSFNVNGTELLLSINRFIEVKE